MNVVWELFSECYAQLPFWYLANVAPRLYGEDVQVNGRTFRILKQLGEGGYAYVYLAKEIATDGKPPISDFCAIKKINAATGDRLTEARREIETLQKVAHPNVVKLLEHSILPSNAEDSDLAYHVYMVFPAYQDGTLFEELERLNQQNRRLSSRDVLDIFHQVCLGVQHMHSCGYAHRDIKPHNILIKRPRRASSSGRLLARGDGDGREAGGGDEECGGAEGGRYEGVLMDLGSARRAVVEVTNRMDALALQEDAEANCTATYRAPELFDVPSQCTVDERVDVWSLGCTLYHMMYGASPFQKAVDTSGASLALAVMNCRVSWPREASQRYPDELHALVMACLASDAHHRPHVKDVLALTRQLQAKGLASLRASGPMQPPPPQRGAARGGGGDGW